MEAFTIKLKDSRYRKFLVQLFSQLDFIEWEAKTSDEQETVEDHDFFSSAGIWSDYDVDSAELRKRAWKN